MRSSSEFCFLLRSRDLRFECIGSGSDFRECIELCLDFLFRFFSNTSVRHVCRRKGGKANKEERDLSFEMQEIAFFLRINVSLAL